MIVYFLFYLVFYSKFVFNLAPQQSYYGVQYTVYGSGSFWLCILLTPAIAILPVFAYRALSLELCPTISDKIRRLWKTGQVEQVQFLGIKPRSSGRMGSKRLGYAFAQEERLSTRIKAGQQRRSKFKSKIKGNR